MVKDMGQHRQNYRQKQFYECPINTSGIRPDGHTSVRDLTLTYTLANENSGTLFVRHNANSSTPFSKGLVKE
jgi:hypothetical protein